ncbi:PE-PGRS family protein, partial [Kitasatospora sp. NPDC058263]
MIAPGDESLRRTGPETRERWTAEAAVVWASFAVGGAPLEGPELTEAWAVGLALNPATPDDVLVGLLGRSAALPWQRLPAAVVDAAVAHRDWKVRASLAEHRWDLSPAQWTRLILDEPDDRRRWLLTCIAADRYAELPGNTHRRLAADPSARVRAEAARLPAVAGAVVAALATDPEPSVRAAACQHGWPQLDDTARREL